MRNMISCFQSCAVSRFPLFISHAFSDSKYLSLYHFRTVSLPRRISKKRKAKYFYKRFYKYTHTSCFLYIRFKYSKKEKAEIEFKY